MSKTDYNNNLKTPAIALRTIGDVREFVKTCGIPAWEVGPIRSALKKADRLVGHGNLDFPADPALIMERLDKYSAAMAGMEDGAWANLKTRVRKAFRLVAPHLAAAFRAERLPLIPVWSAIYSDLPEKDKRPLSRFVHYASVQGWLPPDVTDEHVKRFAGYMKEDALVGSWESVVRDTIRTWNRIAATQKYGELHPLMPSPPKRSPYWISDTEWPVPLRAQRTEFLAHLAQPSSFKGAKVRKFKQSTIKQYGNAVTILVSAAVAQGVPLTTLSSLAEAATPDNLDKALLFLMERGKGEVTPQMFILALRIRAVAAWCGASAEMLTELDRMCATLRPDRRKRGMTAKNRALLDRLEDQRFHDLIDLLPSLLKDRVEKILRKGTVREGSMVKKVRRDLLARLAQTAVALELLLTCSLRRENLVSLELGKSLRKIGQPPDDFWVIDLKDDEVKNDDALRFKLDGETADLLDWYLAEWRLELCEPSNPWLFPGAKGGRMDPKSFTGAIRRAAERLLGVPITPHQFRHLSAELFLEDDPNGLYTVSDHLGHRDPNTTRTYYLRPKQRQASRRYQDQIVLRRERAKVRLRSRKPRKDGGL